MAQPWRSPARRRRAHPSAAGLDLLEERFDVDVGELGSTWRSCGGRCRPAALVADPTVPVDGELLDAAGPTLRVVANFAVGYDNVDLDACRERGVTFTNTPDVLTNATAELALALMMATARRLGEAERMLRPGAGAAGTPVSCSAASCRSPGSGSSAPGGSASASPSC